MQVNNGMFAYYVQTFSTIGTTQQRLLRPEDTQRIFRNVSICIVFLDVYTYHTRSMMLR